MLMVYEQPSVTKTSSAHAAPSKTPNRYMIPMLVRLVCLALTRLTL